MKTRNTKEVENLVSRYKKFINRRGYYPRRLYADHIALAAMAKAIRVSEAIILLTAHNLCDEAFGTTRTLADLSYSIRYIRNKDTESRAKQFAHFYGKDREKWVKIISEYYPLAVMRTSRDHAKLLKLAKQYPHPHRWSGKPISDLALEPDTLDIDPKTGKPIDFRFDYKVIYSWTSHYVHPTVIALEDHIDESGKFQIRARKRTTFSKGEMALFNLVIYLFRIFDDALRILQSELPSRLSRDTDSLLRKMIESD